MPEPITDVGALMPGGTQRHDTGPLPSEPPTAPLTEFSRDRDREYAEALAADFQGYREAASAFAADLDRLQRGEDLDEAELRELSDSVDAMRYFRDVARDHARESGNESALEFSRELKMTLAALEDAASEYDAVEELRTRARKRREILDDNKRVGRAWFAGLDPSTATSRDLDDPAAREVIMRGLGESSRNFYSTVRIPELDRELANPDRRGFVEIFEANMVKHATVRARLGVHY